MVVVPVQDGRQSRLTQVVDVVDEQSPGVELQTVGDLG